MSLAIPCLTMLYIFPLHRWWSWFLGFVADFPRAPFVLAIWSRAAIATLLSTYEILVSWSTCSPSWWILLWSIRSFAEVSMAFNMPVSLSPMLEWIHNTIIYTDVWLLFILTCPLWPLERCFCTPSSFMQLPPSLQPRTCLFLFMGSHTWTFSFSYRSLPSFSYPPLSILTSSL